ncbi:MAG: bifunctional 2',3'-cyclic-nucleotide 2'-phosphodiesterase/3'-nucleotidase [Tabrizicola sp.]|jgi:2',3'-cyclic-nucleotide 2'-phosphodiesterase/3'-nucleotidase|nr:bifunctional 2',3'-cyclic-nucleotide 2'-phosphodiesterase/3'-nucleotidase [Tabrizicola sp.]
MYQVPIASASRPPDPEAFRADQLAETAEQAATASDARPRASLRVIATSDLHASLMPYDYCANRPNSSLGLGAVSQQIAEARGEAQNCLLFDNGDFLQGSPIADYAAAARRRRAHPVITAFNTLGYDAITLGNHEFDYGLRFLSQVLTDARFPVVSANVATRLGRSPARDETLVPPFTILRRQIIDHAGQAHLIRVGVIGFAPPQIEEWDRDTPDGRVHTRDILAAARAWLPRLRARGADIIVALAHSGIGALHPEAGSENAATALAALPEIDAVVAGHSHQVFPGPDIPATAAVDPVAGRLAGKPAVMPGHSASHVGIIDLDLERCRSGARRWRVVGASTRVGRRSADPAPATPALHQALAPDHRAALAWSRRQLGETATPLHTHFATIAPSAALTLIAEAKAEHVRQGLQGTSWEGVPILSSATPFRVGGRGGPRNYTDIPAGPLRMRNLSDLYPFPNTIVTLLLTGAELANWLERTAAIFRQITPGSGDATLLDREVPGFLFETVPQLDYAIDLSQPARFDAQGRLANPDAHRITGLCHAGRAVRAEDEFLLVTNSHRAGRARLQDPKADPQIIFTDGARVQSVIAAHVQRMGQVGRTPRRNWHFLPMPGTSVTFAAGEGSAARLADISSYRPAQLGQDALGFTHYRLHL